MFCIRVFIIILKISITIKTFPNKTYTVRNTVYTQLDDSIPFEILLYLTLCVVIEYVRYYFQHIIEYSISNVLITYLCTIQHMTLTRKALLERFVE